MYGIRDAGNGGLAVVRPHGELVRWDVGRQVQGAHRVVDLEPALPVDLVDFGVVPAVRSEVGVREGALRRDAEGLGGVVGAHGDQAEQLLAFAYELGPGLVVEWRLDGSLVRGSWVVEVLVLRLLAAEPFEKGREIVGSIEGLEVGMRRERAELDAVFMLEDVVLGEAASALSRRAVGC